MYTHVHTNVHAGIHTKMNTFMHIYTHIYICSRNAKTQQNVCKLKFIDCNLVRCIRPVIDHWETRTLDTDPRPVTAENCDACMRGQSRGDVALLWPDGRSRHVLPNNTASNPRACNAGCSNQCEAITPASDACLRIFATTCPKATIRTGWVMTASKTLPQCKYRGSHL